MNALIILAEMGTSRPSGQIARMFGVDWTHLAAQIISFSIVCALLYRYAYRPVLAMLEKRRQLIAQGLADAEKNKAELARTEALREEVVAKANDHASRIIEEAHAAAARVRDKEIQEAHAAAEQIIVKAREAATLEHARMLGEIKHEVGRLVVQTTAKVTRKVLTPEDEHRLIDETLELTA